MNSIEDELDRIRRYIKIGILVYVVFWSLVILLIHLVMVPSLR